MVEDAIQGMKRRKRRPLTNHPFSAKIVKGMAVLPTSVGIPKGNERTGLMWQTQLQLRRKLHKHMLRLLRPPSSWPFKMLEVISCFKDPRMIIKFLIGGTSTQAPQTTLMASGIRPHQIRRLSRCKFSPINVRRQRRQVFDTWLDPPGSRLSPQRYPVKLTKSFHLLIRYLLSLNLRALYVMGPPTLSFCFSFLSLFLGFIGPSPSLNKLLNLCVCVKIEGSNSFPLVLESRGVNERVEGVYPE